jgi:hemoglobin
MNPDIQNRSDIEKLVLAFYEKAKSDAEIGPFFTTIIPIHWEEHLPAMCNFWENALFYTGGYRGNMMEIHRAVHEKIPMSALHFQRWTNLFCQTVDELFWGEKADQAKQHALNMALMLQIKIGIQ